MGQFRFLVAALDPHTCGEEAKPCALGVCAELAVEEGTQCFRPLREAGGSLSSKQEAQWSSWGGRLVEVLKEAQGRKVGVPGGPREFHARQGAPCIPV